MATDDLLQQFKTLLAENNKQLRQEIKEDTKAEVAPLHERLDTQREQISNVEKNLRQEVKDSEKNLRQDIKDSEQHIIEQFSPITNMVLDHDEKIEKLQKAVELHSKH
jgi:DNA repair exonuclease SbcCD ATPase subunit